MHDDCGLLEAEGVSGDLSAAAPLPGMYHARHRACHTRGLSASGGRVYVRLGKRG